MASLIKRGTTYYLQDRLSGKLKRWSLRTDALQIAKERLRQYESARLHGIDSPLPTRTPIADVLTAYVEHIRTVKTAKSAQTDIYYLREAFGLICPAMQITSRRPSPKARKRPLLPGAEQDLRRRPLMIEAAYFEQITTADVTAFIRGQVRNRGLAPKTANRYREILCRLFNWSMKTGLVRMPGGHNPAAKVERYKERAPEIRFLTLVQIDEQLHALRFKPQLQAMVAVLIYAGLRREELLWLTIDDMDIMTRHSRGGVRTSNTSGSHTSGGRGSGASGGGGMIRVLAKTIDSRSWQPKTRINRAIPISRALREYLDRYTPAASDSGWYFPSPEGRWWDPDNFSADLRAANREAGLRWSCLDYRHTFGSQLAQKGVSLYKIATLMGNSPEICRRHYAALTPSTLINDVEFGISCSLMWTGSDLGQVQI